MSDRTALHCTSTTRHSPAISHTFAHHSTLLRPVLSTDRSLAPMYYRGAAAALVVYDITSYDSFRGAKTWIEELQRQGSADIVIGLAGNKCDLEDKRDVPADEARGYAQENRCLFYEMSAKTGENVQNMFQHIAMKLPKQAAAGGAGPAEDSNLDLDRPDEPKKKGCC